MRHLKFYIYSLTITLMDQLLKLWVHYNMSENESIPVFGEWFQLLYVLNPGIAFGFEFDVPNGKLLLTVFRIVAVAAIAYYLYFLANRGTHKHILLALSLVLAGALGNVLDSTFYGVIFNLATDNAPTPWFHGKVIDMFYFPIVRGTFPDWVPIWGANEFLFFRPVFNLADASIFIGVTCILTLQHKYGLFGPTGGDEINLKTKTS